MVDLMMDNDLLTAVGIRPLSNSDAALASELLAEALRIDDRRSAYCEQLETQVAAQAAEIAALRWLLNLVPLPKSRERPDHPRVAGG
jgi:hypothetical protein